MSANSEVLPPPNSPDDFESLCLDLWREIWGAESDLQKNGRSGQGQDGVDLFGRWRGGWAAIQCKKKDPRLGAQVTEAELKDEVGKAKAFHLPLEHFLLATTAARDTKLQACAARLSTENFKVRVWSWDDIWHEIYQRPELLARIKPVYWPQLTAIGKQKIAPSRLSHTADKLFGRDGDLARLASIWDEHKVRLLTLVAFGGVGKTSLVARWAGELAERGYDGADYFDWSFYSQGTQDHSTASADSFIDNALRFFGDEDTAESAKDGWSKGSRLAEILGSRRALLVLDGLEPLQYPPGPLSGELRDPAMKTLLRGLAIKNAGLCVVTTRKNLVGLGASPAAEVWELESLTTQPAVELLRDLGIEGSAKELGEAASEVGGHPLTLRLLARYLLDVQGGAVPERAAVGFAKADARTPDGHAVRVLRAYEFWLEKGGFAGRQDLAVLQVLGTIGRPVSQDCLAAVFEPPVIRGLTDAFFDKPPGWRGWLQAGAPLGPEAWQESLARLERSRLLLHAEGESITLHPWIREYFAEQLRRKQGRAWRAAHDRIFDHLRDTTRYLPASLQELQPLYQAVYHGCQAGRHKEACVEVYRDRIRRGEERFSSSKLGAFGSNAGALVYFFDEPWETLARSLRSSKYDWMLDEAEVCLRKLGRLREAIGPLRAGIQLEVKHWEWEFAALLARRVTALELTLGDIQAALVDAEQCVAFADRSDDTLDRTIHRCTLADVKFQAGEAGAALVLFREAEALQSGLQPPNRSFYSPQGFEYCNFLLAPAERAAGGGQAGDSEAIAACTKVEQWAMEAVERSKARGFSSLKRAFDHLSLGRARLYRAVLEGRAAEAPAAAQDAIEKAVEWLRASGNLDELPHGLLTRAWLRCAGGDAVGVRVDLDEAWEIAERGSMRLHLADVALYRARFFDDRDALAEARRLVTECRYLRRLPEIEDLEARGA